MANPQISGKAIVIILIVIVLLAGIAVGLGAFSSSDSSSTSSLETGSFNLVYDSESIKNRYHEFASKAALDWSEKFNSVHKITIRIGELDLSGNGLGQAQITGYTIAGVDGNKRLPNSGIVKIDREMFNTIIQDSRKINVFKHEFGHILGIGDTRNTNPNTWDTTDDYFLESKFKNALEQYNFELNGDDKEKDRVPVEDTGDVGTRSVHWENNDRAGGLNGKGYSGVPNEIMIGTLEGDGLITELSLGFLMDLGYDVDLEMAEDSISALIRQFELGEDEEEDEDISTPLSFGRDYLPSADLKID